MRFNTDKCHNLTVSASAQSMSKLYKIDGRFLQHVDTATYLGIIIHRTLEFSDHITEAVSKANKKLGFLKRNLKGCPSGLKEMAYISRICSGLEYGAAIWDPHLETQKKAIEQVQNWAIRWCHGLSPHQQCSITQLRKELELRMLEERRLQQRITLLFKIVHGVVVVMPEDLGLEAADGRTCSAHRHKFKEKRAHTNHLKFPVYRSILTRAFFMFLLRAYSTELAHEQKRSSLWASSARLFFIYRSRSLLMISKFINTWQSELLWSWS